jgi:hypothetical protein
MIIKFLINKKNLSHLFIFGFSGVLFKKCMLETYYFDRFYLAHSFIPTVRENKDKKTFINLFFEQKKEKEEKENVKDNEKKENNEDKKNKEESNKNSSDDEDDDDEDDDEDGRGGILIPVFKFFNS